MTARSTRSPAVAPQPGGSLEVGLTPDAGETAIDGFSDATCSSTRCRRTRWPAGHATPGVLGLRPAGREPPAGLPLRGHAQSGPLETVAARRSRWPTATARFTSASPPARRRAEVRLKCKSASANDPVRRLRLRACSSRASASRSSRGRRRREPTTATAPKIAVGGVRNEMANARTAARPSSASRSGPPTRAPASPTRSSSSTTTRRIARRSPRAPSTART